MALFKQITCDICYRPLPNIGRHNRYYFCKIEAFERVHKTLIPQHFDLTLFIST